MQGQPFNEIRYRSADGKPINVDSNAFDAVLIFNELEGNVGVLRFEKDVTIVGEWAFGYCTNLVEIFLPESITNIKWCAFYGCRALKEIDIPQSVTTLGRRVFCGCDSLQKFTGNFASDDGLALIYKGAMVSFAYGADIKEYNVPSGVTSIINWAFMNCKNLEVLVVPDSLNSVGAWAFEGCSSLRGFKKNLCCSSDLCFDKYLIINNILYFAAPAEIGENILVTGVAQIAKRAFSECGRLKKVEIGGDVCQIGDYAFYGCTSLEEIMIDDSIKVVGANAFGQSPSLKKVYCLRADPPKGRIDPHSKEWNAFDKDNHSLEIFVPKGSKELYESAPGWSEYIGQFKYLSENQ